VAIHAVRHLIHPPVKLTAWPDGDPRTSRLVFITSDLSRAIIENGLHAFQSASTPPRPPPPVRSAQSR
jgi:G3E family GTPase